MLEITDDRILAVWADDFDVAAVVMHRLIERSGALPFSVHVHRILRRDRTRV